MKTSSVNRNNLIFGMLAAASLLLCVASAVPTSARVEGSVRQVGQEKKEHFTDDDLKVEPVTGKWMLMTSVDLKQGYDPSVPVIVTYIYTVYGRGKYLRRVKIPEAKIENRSQKILQSVQLRWTVANNDEPDTILLEGVMPPMEVRIEPFNPPLRMDITPVYFNKLVKPLLKDGGLNFHALLIVGVQEARFADGTVWRGVGKPLS